MSEATERPEGEKATVWTLGALEELRDLGCLNLKCTHLTPKGKAGFDQLDAAGYRPPDQHLKACLKAIGPKISFGDEKLILTLLRNFRDNREHLRQFYEKEKSGILKPPDSGPLIFRVYEQAKTISFWGCCLYGWLSIFRWVANVVHDRPFFP